VRLFGGVLRWDPKCPLSLKKSGGVPLLGGAQRDIKPVPPAVPPGTPEAPEPSAKCRKTLPFPPTSNLLPP